MSIFDDIKNTAEGKGRGNPIGYVEHTGQSAINQIKHTGDSVINNIQHTGQQTISNIKHEGSQVIHNIQGEIPNIEKLVESSFKKIAVPVISDLMKPIEKIVFTTGYDILEHAYTIATSTTRNKDFIDNFNKISFYIANSGNFAVGLYFRNVWNRAPMILNELKKLERGIPLKRSAILEAIEKLGPDAIDITGTIKFNVGVDIGGSVGAWGIPAELFDILIEELLKKAGIPE